MVKQPANLAGLVKRRPSSEAEPEAPIEKPQQRAPRKAPTPAPEPERDLAPARRLSFACSAKTYLDLQLHKAHTGRAHQDIVAEALEDYLRRHAAKRKG